MYDPVEEFQSQTSVRSGGGRVPDPLDPPPGFVTEYGRTISFNASCSLINCGTYPTDPLTGTLSIFAYKSKLLF